ncbi:MAG: ATP-binding cassette domain-containing protein, partial [Acetobacterales bacterium]
MSSRLDIGTRLSRGDFRLDIERAFELDGITALFGASGSGKTTLLRLLAGLEPGAHGRIAFAGETWQDDTAGVFVQPHRRGAGLVFQDARLFPHLGVRGNLTYAERRAPRGEDGIAFDDVIGALDLGPLLNRGIGNLSGGERQRVAIGRTLL